MRVETEDDETRAFIWMRSRAYVGIVGTQATRVRARGLPRRCVLVFEEPGVEGGPLAGYHPCPAFRARVWALGEFCMMTINVPGTEVAWRNVGMDETGVVVAETFLEGVRWK
ncbi:hypothetical protein DFH09DRAFT_1344101 [Mycena vulgaris]|nr:hypothetical protein DFH09DRAFT_1344101 [Mycena vulgaris]